MNKTSQAIRDFKTKKQFRDFKFDRAHVDEDARTVALAFSSEEPYERYFGVEILDHDAGSINLGRLKDGGAVLVDHNPTDHVGVVESISIDDRIGRAVVRFGKGERANEIFNDVIDGIRSKVSVGYMVHEMVLEKQHENEPDEYRVTNWEPLEVSLVSIPADASVGVGRALEELTVEIEKSEQTLIKQEHIKMPDKDKTEFDASAERAKIRTQEKERVRELSTIADMYPQLETDVREAIQGDITVEQFRAVALKKIHNAREIDVNSPPAEIGMEEKDLKDYSMFRAIKAAAKKDWRGAELEREVHIAVAERTGKDAEGFFVPYDVLSRDLSFAVPTAGGNLVGTDHLSGSFIDMLRNRARVASLGATIIDGLVGNVDIPKQSGGATFYWIDNEATNTTESQQAFGQVVMSPKTVSGRVDMTRRLLMQSSPSVEALVRADLAAGAALAIDYAAINGSGAAGQPTGILNQTGIGDVAGGANGLAPTWAHMVALETEVSVDNADIGALAYLTNSKVRGKLKTTEMFGGTNGLPVWERGANPLNGYNAAVSNQVPSDLTKGTSVGVASASIFGNWNDLMIGMWSGLDLKVDEVTNGDKGGLVLRVFQDIDVAVRHAESFAAMQDILTA